MVAIAWNFCTTPKLLKVRMAVISVTVLGTLFWVTLSSLDMVCAQSCCNLYVIFGLFPREICSFLDGEGLDVEWIWQWREKIRGTERSGRKGK